MNTSPQLGVGQEANPLVATAFDVGQSGPPAQVDSIGLPVGQEVEALRVGESASPIAEVTVGGEPVASPTGVPETGDQAPPTEAVSEILGVSQGEPVSDGLVTRSADQVDQGNQVAPIASQMVDGGSKIALTLTPAGVQSLTTEGYRRPSLDNLNEITQAMGSAREKRQEGQPASGR